MPYGRSKTDNEYARLVFAVDASKTVWMALAVSFAVRSGVSLDRETLAGIMLQEWQLLHQNGIVPQKPRKG